MSQAKLVKVEQKENGVKLTFLDFDGKELTGIYNGNELNSEKLEKMLGQHISFSEASRSEDKYEEAVGNFITVHKAWDKNNKPTFCDDPKHGIDR